jgi:exonuclease I
MPYLARELGVNRYEHVVGFDFSAGDRYWERSRDFWRNVRDAWSDVFSEEDAFELLDEVDGRQMFEPFFEYADRLDQGERYDPGTARELIRETLATYLR